MTIYVATSNAGKLRDFDFAAQQSEAGDKVKLLALPGLKALAPPVEDQDTFEGNARLKAMYYSQHAPGALVLADDSGLEVNALDGRPGVRSARFAEDCGSLRADGDLDSSNNDTLLLYMLEQTDRRARYRCVLALARDGQVLATAAGELQGEILTDAEGEGGFGYDPLFFLPELDCSMAQASLEDRLRLSHRGRALRALLAKPLSSFVG